jgi:hypothetical protein
LHQARFIPAAVLLEGALILYQASHPPRGVLSLDKAAAVPRLAEDWVKGVDVWHKDADVRPVRLGSLQMNQDVRFPEADDSLGEVKVTLSLTVIPSVGMPGTVPPIETPKGAVATLVRNEGRWMGNECVTVRVGTAPLFPEGFAQRGDTVDFEQSLV